MENDISWNYFANLSALNPKYFYTFIIDVLYSMCPCFLQVIPSHLAALELLNSWELIESQNHRMVSVGRDLKDHLVPILLPCAENCPLDQGTEAPIQSDLEHFQGWCRTSLGDLFQSLTIPTVKNLFLISNLNLPSFVFKGIPPLS